MQTIKNYRLAHSLSRKDLAEKLGVSAQLIAHIENGIRRVTPEKAKAWEEKTGIPREVLCPEVFARAQ